MPKKIEHNPCTIGRDVERHPRALIRQKCHLSFGFQGQFGCHVGFSDAMLRSRVGDCVRAQEVTESEQHDQSVRRQMCRTALLSSTHSHTAI